MRPRGVVTGLAALLSILFLLLAVVPDGRLARSTGPAVGTAFLQGIPDEPAPMVRASAMAAMDAEEVAGDPWPGALANSAAAALESGCSLPRRRVDARAAADRPVPERPPRSLA